MKKNGKLEKVKNWACDHVIEITTTTVLIAGSVAGFIMGKDIGYLEGAKAATKSAIANHHDICARLIDKCGYEASMNAIGYVQADKEKAFENILENPQKVLTDLREGYYKCKDVDDLLKHYLDKNSDKDLFFF